MDSATEIRDIAHAEEHLQAWIEALPAHFDLRCVLRQLEHSLLLRALRTADGVQAAAARTLSISRSDMAYKVRKFNLDV